MIRLLFEFCLSTDIDNIRAVIRFWVACLNIKSSVSDSQPHYSIILLYHGIAGLYSGKSVKSDSLQRVKLLVFV